MAFFRLHSRHWLVDEKGRIIIGEGRMAILENIEKTGSINLTAKMMKMSYKESLEFQRNIASLTQDILRLAQERGLSLENIKVGGVVGKYKGTYLGD